MKSILHRYAHENGCEWDKDTCDHAAHAGQLRCLRLFFCCPLYSILSPYRLYVSYLWPPRPGSDTTSSSPLIIFSDTHMRTDARGEKILALTQHWKDTFLVLCMSLPLPSCSCSPSTLSLLIFTISSSHPLTSTVLFSPAPPSFPLLCSFPSHPIINKQINK